MQFSKRRKKRETFLAANQREADSLLRLQVDISGMNLEDDRRKPT
jgi:hypothetical protein